MSNFYDNDDLLWDSEIGEETRDKHKSKRNKHNRRQLSDQKRQAFEPEQSSRSNSRP
ncbi:hypothetical protein [Shewanella woodyi]|uniref:hypothetical protein n=1 Tax=Shewanella woodyi TaxID=60961 RepID=UPI003748E1A0